MNFLVGHHDIIVIGGGHAGCEAGLAAPVWDLIRQYLLYPLSPLCWHVTLLLRTSKGHLVREIDALWRDGHKYR